MLFFNWGCLEFLMTRLEQTVQFNRWSERLFVRRVIFMRRPAFAWMARVLRFPPRSQQGAH